MRVVHPVAAERRIVRVDEQGRCSSARRSPKRSTAVEVFDKLVAFPSLLSHPNLTIEVLLLREDHIRGRSRSRSGGATGSGGAAAGGRGRPGRAADAGGHRRGAAGAPAEAFTTRELAALLRCSTMLAQRTLYCLRAMDIVEPAGKRGRAPLHALSRFS